MTTALVGILLVAVLFAVFGLMHRGHACDGACPGCGTGCSHWVAPGERRGMEVDRVGK
jgi:hypothetical protein